MNKSLVSIFVVFSVLVCSEGYLYAQMTDEAIIDYITEGLSTGKSQAQIGNELMARGVTVSQVKRVIQEYRNNPDAKSLSSAKKKSESDSALDRRKQNKRTSSDERTDPDMDEENPVDREKFKDKEEYESSESAEFERRDSLRKQFAKKVPKIRIFGHDLFTSKNLSFEPNQNVATPGNYVIGPGDELIIDIWGVNEASIKETVTPEGRIYLSQIGPVNLSGLTIDQATSKLKKVLSQKYSLSGSNPASKLSLTLGNIRSIQVHIMGEVKVPGTYRLSSLSSIFHALYRAGGVNELGSLRNIRIMRGGKVVSVSDIYRFLFNGDDGGKISLQDGDAIVVPPYSSLVKVTGGVKRPMYYETLENEALQVVIDYAGGFTANAFRDEVTVERKDASEGSVFTVPSTSFENFGLNDGDIVTVYTNRQQDVYKNRVEIKGSVIRPGVYAIGGEIATVRQLVEHAGGLLEDAFLARAQIIREKADRSLEIKAVAIGAIMTGEAEDIALRRNDVLIISNAGELDTKGDITINGYVVNPSDYPYAEGMSVEDLILLAGGLADGAVSARVDVSRRIVDFSSQEASDTLALVFSFNITDGLMVDGNPDFVLQPYDVVSVRRSPTYKEQSIVRVSGEATFPGEYTLVSNNERLSDIFKRINGVTPNAYIGGAMLRRKVSEDERNVRKNMINMIKNGGNRKDSTIVRKLQINESYTVGIDLQAALEKPGSDIDLILRNGDELIIPSLTNTVRIQGEVMYPNAVNYIPGKNLKYYIKQAGGYSNEAKRSKVYVVYMNGKVGVGKSTRIIPGCEVIVPSRPEHQKISVGEWLGIGTTAASLTTMIATIANLIKK